MRRRPGARVPGVRLGQHPGTKFCGECGARLVIQEAAPGDRRMDQPAHERRVVSVLFADLVGFTTLSESLDAEEVRDLLTRYFDVCRTLIARYGGVVEKFIGDAVMAVWGTPVATEHDSERAVRAAMELTAAVATLGQEIGAPALRARAGVLTGEAAVDLDARGESMVAGDLVNTASRVQSVAQPRRRPGGRSHEAGDRGGDRLRGRRGARAEGEVRARPALARRPRDRRDARLAPQRRPRSSVRGTRPRAPPREGHVPRRRGGRASTSCR